MKAEKEEIFEFLEEVFYYFFGLACEAYKDKGPDEKGHYHVIPFVLGFFVIIGLIINTLI